MYGHLEAISLESDRVAELIPCSDLEQRVPSCPDWLLRDLVLHLGEVQRFWAENVLAADESEPWSGERTAPTSDEELEEWFRGGSALLLDALGNAKSDAPCWTWWDSPRTAGAVARHQVQEAAVHRWDAESSVGAAQPIDSAVADDGVGEFLSIMVGRGAEVLEHPIRLVSSNTASAWVVGPAGSQPAATVRAKASDLVLMLYGRAPLSVAEIVGDPGAADIFFGTIASG